MLGWRVGLDPSDATASWVGSRSSLRPSAAVGKLGGSPLHCYRVNGRRRGRVWTEDVSVVPIVEFQDASLEPAALASRAAAAPGASSGELLQGSTRTLVQLSVLSRAW